MILAQYRPHSLIEHIGAGGPWDLDREHTGGVRIYTPYRSRKFANWFDGTADAVLADHDFLVTYVSESNGELEFLATVPTAGAGISIGLRQSDTELRATFNAAIESMKADGSLNALLRQWFGEPWMGGGMMRGAMMRGARAW